MSQENVELARRAFDAFNRRDLDALLAIMDDDVEAESRFVAMEGGYRGHDGIRRWWQDTLDAFPDLMVEVVEVRAVGEMTLSQLRFGGHGAGSGIPVVVTPVWHVSNIREERASGGASFNTRRKPSKPWRCGASGGKSSTAVTGT